MKLIKTVKYILLIIFSCFGVCIAVKAQCPPGEIEVTMEIRTSSWGSAAYWELVPTGSACGSNTIVSGGNSAVGCNGGGIWNLPTGGYPDYSTITEGPWCLTIGNTYDIIYVSDCGNDDVTFNIYCGPAMFYTVTFITNIVNDTFTFVVQVPPKNNLRISEIAFRTDSQTGNTPDSTAGYIYPYIPQCQSSYDTLDFWSTIQNDGTNPASNVILHVEVSGAEFFTTTSYPLNLLGPNSTVNLNGQMTYAPSTQGNYSIKFFVTSDSIDGLNHNDTVYRSFSLSDTVYARDLNDFSFFGWFGQGNSYVIGNLFEISKTETATSISVFIVPEQGNAFNPVGKTISFEIYDMAVSPPALLAQEFHSVDNSEVLTWVSQPISGGGVSLTPGTYLVAYQTYTDSFLYAYGKAATPPYTSFVDIGGIGIWYYLNFTPLIRLNLGDCIISTTRKKNFNTSFFNLVPNPTKDLIKLKMIESAEENFILELFNIFGQIIMTDQVLIKENETLTYDLSNYNKGIYFLKVKNNFFEYMEKLILY